MVAKFIDLGRGKVNTTVTVKDTKELHKEIQKHVASKNWDMYETETPNVYAVDSGWRSIGKVEIISE